jgi:hypothetical protein
VRRLSGQAALHTGRVLHAIATVVLGATVLLTVAVVVAAWRLSQGPVDVSWLTHRIEAAASPARLTIGTTALAWEGFRSGVDQPLDLRLTDVSLAAPGGGRLLEVPRAEVALSIGNLLLGRIVPRAAELDDARLILHRAVDGTVRLRADRAPVAASPSGPSPDSEPLTTILAELARPAGNDRSAAQNALSQLQHVRIRNATIEINDRRIGAVWRAPPSDIDLNRRVQGGVDGTADLSLALGGQTTQLAVSASLMPGAEATRLHARLTPTAPAALAQAAPALAPLAALDAPVGLDAAVQLDANLHLTHARLTARSGAGQLRIGTSSVPLRSAAVVLAGTPGQIAIETARVEVQGHDGGPLTTLQGSGQVRRDADRISVVGSLAMDQVALADLSRLWPAGIGGDAQRWVTENITTGIAHDAHVDLALEAGRDLSDVVLTHLTGSVDGNDVTAHWLRPVPPIDQGRVQLRLLDPDTIEIALLAGHQQGRGNGTGLTLRSGRMRITGLSTRDQVGMIEADVAGSLPNAVALLKEPRLNLLDRQPIAIRDPAGDVTASVTVKLPLAAIVRMDDVAVHAAARLTGVHLASVVAGRNLDQGNFDLIVDNGGLTLKGHTLLAGIDTDVDAAMDFGDGPPTQVLQRVTVSGHASAGQLAAAGLDAGGVLAGNVGLKAVLTERRAGDGDIAVTADLSQASLVAAPLGWSKAPGSDATARARLVLDHDRPSGIDRFVLNGVGVSVRGDARFVGGRVSVITVDRALLGSSDLQGTVRLPPDGLPGGLIEADLAGPMLDLSAKLSGKSAKREKPHGPPAPGPPWNVTARFDRVRLGGGEITSNVVARAQNDGGVLRMLSVSGETGPRAPFALSIGAAGGVRRLSAKAANAGALLRGLGVVGSMEGGRLVLTGTYDDTNPWHPLTATAEIDEFRIRDAPWLAKLLQAMTLYGLADVLHGPGVGFSRLVAPFRLDQDGLLLNDARAFSPSLGITARGRIDLDAQAVDVQGTIVPAYFFNSLLGNVPLVGKLFSPERGGGVFAARYSVKGGMDDPTVSVNALSALTPGFLREVFGIF